MKKTSMLTTHMYQPVTECVWTEGMNNLFPETQYRQQKCNNKTNTKSKRWKTYLAIGVM